jgi:hypothetical protein
MNEDGNENAERESLLGQWGQTMYPDLWWQPDTENRLVDKGGSILVKRRFDGEENLSHLKVPLHTIIIILVYCTPKRYCRSKDSQMTRQQVSRNDKIFLRHIYGRICLHPWSMHPGGESLFLVPSCIYFFGIFSLYCIGISIMNQSLGVINQCLSRSRMHFCSQSILRQR